MCTTTTDNGVGYSFVLISVTTAEVVASVGVALECSELSIVGSVVLLFGERPQGAVLVLVVLFAGKSPSSTIVTYFKSLGSGIPIDSKTVRKFKETRRIQVYKDIASCTSKFWGTLISNMTSEFGSDIFLNFISKDKYCSRGTIFPNSN